MSTHTASQHLRMPLECLEIRLKGKIIQTSVSFKWSREQWDLCESDLYSPRQKVYPAFNKYSTYMMRTYKKQHYIYQTWIETFKKSTETSCSYVLRRGGGIVSHCRVHLQHLPKSEEAFFSAFWFLNRYRTQSAFCSWIKEAEGLLAKIKFYAELNL